MKVSVIGTGTMGSGIALAFAQAKVPVLMKGVSQQEVDAGLRAIDLTLSKGVEKEKITKEEKREIESFITTTTNYQDCTNSQLIIEAVLEQIELKREIFSKLDTICNEETILASNTSSLSITEIASYTKRADRVIGMHFFNPAPVMKLVEIIKGQLTSKEVQDFVYNVALKIGKTPVNVNEYPGFVVNRILVPMVNEAIAIFAEGVASAKDIDLSMKLGANHPMGPLALGDLIGLDVCLAIMDVLYTEFGDSKYRAHPLLRKMVRSGQLGRKSGIGFYQY